MKVYALVVGIFPDDHELDQVYTRREDALDAVARNWVGYSVDIEERELL